MRLSLFISRSGYTSRRKADCLIKEGKVSVGRVYRGASRGASRTVDTVGGGINQGIDTVGGGIRSLDDIYNVLRSGADKVSINDVIYNALSLITSQYKNHGILLSVETEDDNCYTIGNKYKLEQVVLNLLSNAKYAVDEKKNQEDGGNFQKMITIRSSIQDENAVVSIEDNGIGIPDKIRDNIFDPFFTTKKAEVGTGLGLSIIYGIIQDMKGEIKVESEVNKFTRMIISVPLYKT